MRLAYRADQRVWLHVPASFPSELFGSAAEWEADVVARYREGRPDAPQAELDAVLALAREAASTTATAGDFGLQFWPLRSPIAAVVSVVTTDPLPADVDPVEALMHGIPLAAPPNADPVSVEGIGEGWIVRFIADVPDAREPVAGIGVVLAGPRCAVFARSEPTTTVMVGLLEGPLREVVHSFALVP